jgi:hypothetical protein
VQYSSKVSQQFYRDDMLMVIASVGSIVFLLQKVSSKIVDGSADFSLTKDMMHRLYTMDKKKPD